MDAGCTKAVIADVAAIVDDEVKLLVGLVGAVDQVIAKAIAQVIIVNLLLPRLGVVDLQCFRW